MNTAIMADAKSHGVVVPFPARGTYAVELAEAQEKAERLRESLVSEQDAALEMLVEIDNQRIALQEEVGKLHRIVVELEEKVYAQSGEARTDALTGVLNRRGYDESLDAEMRRARRRDTPLSIVLLDCDHFKEVNDTYGHIEGDGVLKTLAAVIQMHVREMDTVARYGGEEFAVILPETTVDGAFSLAEKLRQLIADTPFCFEGVSYRKTASFGVATYTPSQEVGLTPEQFTKRVDDALYTAKREGRDRTSVYPLEIR